MSDFSIKISNFFHSNNPSIKENNLNKSKDTKIKIDNNLNNKIYGPNMAPMNTKEVETLDLDEINTTQGSDLMGLSDLEYVNALAKIAREDYKKTGVLASVTISQAIEEGGWPKNWTSSNVAIKNNNIFGIIKSDEYSHDNKVYANFENIEEGISTHSSLFTNKNDYYPEISKYNNNPKDFLNYVIPIYAPEEDGNDPEQYIKDCLSIINKYDLTKYDKK
jgi:flagellum-specific peptidoglycan hydrolase FlgJ